MRQGHGEVFGGGAAERSGGAGGCKVTAADTAADLPPPGGAHRGARHGRQVAAAGCAGAALLAAGQVPQVGGTVAAPVKVEPPAETLPAPDKVQWKHMHNRMGYLAKKGVPGPLQDFHQCQTLAAKRAFCWHKFTVDPSFASYEVMAQQERSVEEVRERVKG